MTSLNFKKLSRETFSNENPISEWDNSEYLLKFYKNLVEELGEPSNVVNKKNGIVVWDQNSPNKKWGNWIVEHYLKDEKVHHCVPKKHTDFFYTTVKIFVPADKVPLVQSISGSVILDLLKNTVTARCGSTKANYATLRTVVDVLQRDLDYPKSQISKMYKKNLNNMGKDKQYNMNRIKEYVIYNPVKDMEYHPFAFPESCENQAPPKINDNPKTKEVTYKSKQNGSKIVELFSKTLKMKELKYKPSSHIPKMKKVFYKK